MSDLLQASAGLVRLRVLQTTLASTPTLSLRNLTHGVAAAPMTKIDLEEDFV